MKVAFLFPGQGTQYAGMLHDVIDTQINSSTKILEILDHLDLHLDEVDSADALKHTANVQLCLLLTGVCTAHHLNSLGIQADYVGGNSIGAFGAAVISGAINLLDAAKLVMLRGSLMEAAYPSGYGMLACVGFSNSRLTQEVNSFNATYSEKEWIYLANYNTPIQIVLAGPLLSLHAFAEILESKGIRSATILKMSVPSHCKLMDNVAHQLSKAVNEVDLEIPKLPYLSNMTGRLIRNKEGLVKDLGNNVAHTVLWNDGMQLLYEMGTRFYVEMCPSGVLTKIINDQFEDSAAIGINLNNWDTILYRYKNFII